MSDDNHITHYGEVFYMLKKMILIIAASGAAVLGEIGLFKGSKKMRMRRMIKRIGMVMYNLGTMLRVTSMNAV